VTPRLWSMAPARWRVRLNGELFDLEDLPRMFSAPGLRVIVEGDAYFLEAAAFDREADQGAVFAEAERLLPTINGAARLVHPNHRNVSLSGQVVEPGAPDEPTNNHMFVKAGTVTARAKVFIPTILVEGAEPPPPGSAVTDRWARLASADAGAAKALTFWSKPHDWVNLYKVYEIVGKKKAIVDAGWATEAEVSAFTGSANHQKASGDDARHSRLPGDRPKRVITLAEADAFVAHLLTSWLAAMPDP
jgi:hypothetical protein